MGDTAVAGAWDLTGIGRHGARQHGHIDSVLLRYPPRANRMLVFGGSVNELFSLWTSGEFLRLLGLDLLAACAGYEFVITPACELGWQYGHR
jgi:hypothetical protein